MTLLLKRNLKMLAAVGLLAYVGWLVWLVLTDPLYLWDFKGYYYAVKGYGEGLNPYDTAALTRHYGFKLFEFVYPPVTLWLFKPLTLLSYEWATSLFVAIKVVMLASLFYLWQRHFLSGRPSLLFYFFALLAFNGALYIDFSSGNISIIEQFFLWWAFYFWRKGRLDLFGVGVLIAATFKLTPILFLGLLLFSPQRDKWRYLAGFLALFGFSLLGSYLFAPDLSADFVISVGRLDERGIYNPSTLAFLRDLSLSSANSALAPLQLILYAAAIGLIGLFSWRPLRRVLIRLPWPDRANLILFLACLVYALVLPRFKNYSYILLVPVVYFVWLRLRNLGRLPPMVFLLVAAILPGADITLLERAALPGTFLLSYYLTSYYTLFTALITWEFYLYYLRQVTSLPPPVLDEPLARQSLSVPLEL